jgi:multidrug efflux pump
VIFLFLRNLKATIIPLVTIPISLVGSFVFLKIFGCSINIMTLLAMVLAIGLVVDDAIIVLENIQRHIESGLTPAKAAMLGAKEIGFAIVAMTLTLTSVYAPLVFIQGAIGDLFIEFAIALAGSVLISGVVALTLSPLMCSKALKHSGSHQSNQVLWPQIDRWLATLASNYKTALAQFFLYPKRCGLILGIVIILIATFANLLPKETAPPEDRNFIGVYVPPLVGKNIDAMEQKLLQLETKLGTIPEAAQTIMFMGDWGGNLLFPLKPQSDRSKSASALVKSAEAIIDTIPSTTAYAWSDDSGLPGIEQSQGEELKMVISTTNNYHELYKTTDSLVKTILKEQIFPEVWHSLKLDTPNYLVNLDHNAMAELNINPHQVANTLEVFFSGSMWLKFTKDGLSYDINLKGKQEPWGLEELYLTNKFGKRISLGAVASLVTTTGPNKLFHYNQMRATNVAAKVKDNANFNTNMQLFAAEVSKNLPQDYKYSWTGKAELFLQSQHTMQLLFVLAVIFIYAILAVQFESWLDPLLILITVPLACLGGLALIWATGGSLNIYTQIGLITLIGLISKHGILIVEFANKLLREGTANVEVAVVTAASLRLRPILMTTSAMILGVIPLVAAHGEGSEAQHAIGIVLVGGLVVGTIFTLFVLPAMYYFIKIRVARA